MLPCYNLLGDGEIRSGLLLQKSVKDVQNDWRAQGISAREGRKEYHYVLCNRYSDIGGGTLIRLVPEFDIALKLLGVSRSLNVGHIVQAANATLASYSVPLTPNSAGGLELPPD